MKFTVGLMALVMSLQVSSAIPKKNEIRLLKEPNGKKMNVQKGDIISLERLEQMFVMDSTSPGLGVMLKRHTLKHRQKAVPLLIKVMKESKFPEQNRWHATMLLGQIMGKQSAPFIAKFADHPHWMMRVASLKALLALKQDSYHNVYRKSLQDPSLIVRVQALDNISQMNIKPLAPAVWGMMYDGTNYSGDAGNRKRTSIVKSIIRTLGDLKFEKAKGALARLIQKPKYQDLVEDLDYSLEKITGLSSPNKADERRKFWSKHAVAGTKKI